MHQSNQKAKQIAYNLIQQYDFSSYSKEFLRSLMAFLQLEDNKNFHKNMVAERVVQIYEITRNQYEKYLMNSKFKHINSEVKDLLWTIFKQFDERWKQRKTIPIKSMVPREHLNSHYVSPNQNMNMNMVNMFMEVPNLQSVEEIEVFQRKMFQIYKNFMPQVLTSMHMSSQYYRPQNSYNPYSMSSIGSMSNLNSMGNMTQMAGMGMPMNSYNPMPNRNSLAGLNSLSPIMTQKPTQFYEPTSNYANRYLYENKMGNAYCSPQNMQRCDKNMMNDYSRSNSQSHIPSTGFSFYNDRPQTDQYKFKLKPMPYSQNKIAEEGQKKSIYSQKYFTDDYRFENNLHNSSQYEHEINNSPFRQKERQYPMSNLQSYYGQQPRKITKKDDEVSIINQEGEAKNEKFKKPTISIQICKESGDSTNCYHCKIIELDPLNEVNEVIKLQMITPQTSEVKFTVNKKVLQKINKNPDKLDIEIRCLKMQKQFQNCITWPDRARLSADQEIIQNISQSQHKKRKQKPFILSKHFGNQKNFQDSIQFLLQVPRNQKQLSVNYLCGIFIVMKHTIKQMQEMILKDSVELNMSSFFNNKKFLKPEQIQNECISVNVLDTLSKNLIRIPVRGIECVHAQCFDLQDYLALLYRSLNREWICPICGEQAKKFYIDNELKRELLNVSKMVQLPKQILFYFNGAKIVKYNEVQAQKRNQQNSQDPNNYNKKIQKEVSKAKQENQGKSRDAQKF